MKKILSTFALFFAYSSTTLAACVTGTCVPATRYDVNVQEVALCQDAACASNYVVGSGTKTFDIASAAVGAAVGSYANVDAIPVGTYTYIRVIFNRTFTLTGGVNGACAAQTAASLSIPTPAELGGTDVLAGTAPTMTWNDAAKTQVRVLQALATPITISKGATRPSVTVKFDTQTGLMCAPNNLPYPAPPDVTISVL